MAELHLWSRPAIAAPGGTPGYLEATGRGAGAPTDSLGRAGAAALLACRAATAFAPRAPCGVGGVRGARPGQWVPQPPVAVPSGGGGRAGEGELAQCAAGGGKAVAGPSNRPNSSPLARTERSLPLGGDCLT